jgi:hypothetical protein
LIWKRSVLKDQVRKKKFYFFDNGIEEVDDTSLSEEALSLERFRHNWPSLDLWKEQNGKWTQVHPQEYFRNSYTLSYREMEAHFDASSWGVTILRYKDIVDINTIFFIGEDAFNVDELIVEAYKDINYKDVKIIMEFEEIFYTILLRKIEVKKRLWKSEMGFLDRSLFFLGVRNTPAAAELKRLLTIEKKVNQDLEKRKKMKEYIYNG